MIMYSQNPVPRILDSYDSNVFFYAQYHEMGRLDEG